METIAEAKQFLQENWNEGTHCPVCKQFVKLYQRRITSSMARALILFYQYFRKNPGEKWLHMMNYMKELPVPAAMVGGDNAKLKYWGLIECKAEERNDGSDRNGYVCITEKGRAFVENRITVPSHVFLYNQEVRGFSEKQVGIRWTLGKGFDYSELMKGYEVETPIRPTCPPCRVYLEVVPMWQGKMRCPKCKAIYGYTPASAQ